MSRVELERGFVLHRRPYRETSLLVEAFSLNFGRVGLVARGARRRQSRLSGVLQPFQTLLLSWAGSGELVSLIRAEIDGRIRPLGGRLLKSGFYVNELLLRLLHRYDAHPELFEAYRDTLVKLGEEQAEEPVLRIFEKRLLDAIGYGLVLDRDVDAFEVLEPDRVYCYWPDRGPIVYREGCCGGVRVSGSTLVALAKERLDDPHELREAKYLMRVVLNNYLGGKPLASRALFKPVGT